MAMKVLHNNCNMYMGNLTDMYALALEPTAHILISQITRANVTTITCRSLETHNLLLKALPNREEEPCTLNRLLNEPLDNPLKLFLNVCMQFVEFYLLWLTIFHLLITVIGKYLLYR